MPLKRHKALQEYSKEHHDELLLVWKIRTGLEKNIQVNRIVGYCHYFFNHSLLPHFRKEEKYILPKLSQEREDVKKIQKEHELIAAMMNALDNDSVDTRETLRCLTDILELHIRFEERTFFEEIQVMLPDEVLQTMGPAEKVQIDCDLWQDEFWKE